MIAANPTLPSACCYSLKAINQNKKSEYSVHRLQITEKGDQNEDSPEPPPAKKKFTSDGKTKSSSKGDLLVQKINEVDEIALKLSDKHSQSFTVEQIRAWAHLIQIEKH